MRWWSVILLALAPAADVPPHKNAAMQYWLAFELAPRWNTLPKEDRELFDNWDTVPLTKDRVERLKLWQTALKYVHRGAALTDCVWPSDVNFAYDGIGTYTPHLDHATTLTRLACLRARWKFEQGKPDEAFRDLLAVLKLTHHVRHNGGMLPFLRMSSTEPLVWRCVARHVGHADRESITAFLKACDTLPKPTQAAEAIRVEGEHMAAWFATRGLHVGSPLPGEEEYYLDPDDAPLGTLAFFAGLQTEAEAVAEFITATQHAYGRAAECAAVPLEKFQESAAAYAEQFGDKGPAVSPDPIVNTYGKLIAPGVQVRLTELRVAAVREMARAALVARAKGMEPSRPGQDPFTGKPFLVKKTPDGYELRTNPTPLLPKPAVLSIRTAAPSKP
ncbi:MAG TPA: hypothetical protein VM533_20430 [Fimbriiglobus sp.]|jgi:hypothetical protein|nr:hypothetical protein [Fimbriiglobus sp.]